MCLPNRWTPARDGELSEEALRLKLLEGNEYRIYKYQMPPGTFIPAHTHDIDKSEAVLSGRLRIWTKDQEVDLEPGDFLPIPRGTIHSAEALENAPVVCIDRETPRDPDRDRLLPWRLLALALLLLLVNSWMARHLGTDTGNFLLLNAIIVILPKFFTYLTEAQNKSVEEFFRGGFTYLIATPTLLVLSLAIIVAGSCVSSVTVIPEPNDSKRTVQLGAVTSPHADSSQQSERRLDLMPSGEILDLPLRRSEWTLPFGQLYRLKVSGYFTHDFVLLPWVGKQIRVRDLNPVPNIILRVPFTGLTGGVLTLHRILPSNPRLLLTEKTLSQYQGSLVYGAGNPIPETRVDDWRERLSKDDYSPEDEARIVDAWTNPVIVISDEIQQGFELQACFRLSSNLQEPHAGKRFYVGSAKIQDHRLNADKKDTRGCESP